MPKMKKINLLLLTFIFHLVLCIVSSYAAVKINLIAINPSDTEKQKLVVKYELPHEVRKADILDPGGLDIDYDVTKDAYYVYKEIELAPKQTQTFQVTIQDKWNIPEEKIEELKNKLSEKLNALQGTDQYETAKLMAGNINAKFEDIIKSQNETAADIERRIELNRVNLKLLSQLENDMLALDYFISKATHLQEAPTVRYFIEALNPTDSPIETTVATLLPKGVKPEYIVTNPGFNVYFDKDLNQYYLSKQEKLEAKEVKQYEIELKDMWSFTDKMLSDYKNEADAYKKILTESKYKKLAGMLCDEINKYIDDISTSQSIVAALKERISSFQVNSEKDKKITDNIDKLKSMVAEVVRNQQLFTVLKEQSPEAQLKVAEFKKKAMPKIAVWTIVLFLLGFLVLFTLVATAFLITGIKKTESKKYNKIEKPEPKPPV